MASIKNLEAMLDRGQDNAMLRFGLGNAYLQEKDYLKAIEHLRRAVAHDPGYSAAWKLLGKALAVHGDEQAAIDAYKTGISEAEKKGDKQAIKEMEVFLKRLLHQRRDQN